RFRYQVASRRSFPIDTSREAPSRRNLGIKVIETPNALRSPEWLYRNPQARADDLHWTLENSQVELSSLPLSRRIDAYTPIHRPGGLVIVLLLSSSICCAAIFQGSLKLHSLLRFILSLAVMRDSGLCVRCSSDIQKHSQFCITGGSRRIVPRNR